MNGLPQRNESLPILRIATTILTGVAADVKSNIIRYIAAAIVTTFLSGAFFIWTTGGVYIRLPGQVDAMQQAFDAQTESYEKLIDEQQKLNLEQQAINKEQQRINDQILDNYKEIKDDIRDINQFLRAQ
jgi:hypothetical protein